MYCGKTPQIFLILKFAMRKQGIAIRRAGKKGFGVFAKRQFAKNEQVLTYDYAKVKRFYTAKEIFTLSEKQQDHLDYFRKNKYVLGYSAWFRVNHSCDPNARIKPLGVLRRVIVAKRTMMKGDEITIDYGAYPNDRSNVAGYEKIVCHCGAKNCRKVIF